MSVATTTSTPADRLDALRAEIAAGCYALPGVPLVGGGHGKRKRRRRRRRKHKRHEKAAKAAQSEEDSEGGAESKRMALLKEAAFECLTVDPRKGTAEVMPATQRVRRVVQRVIAKQRPRFKAMEELSVAVDSLRQRVEGLQVEVGRTRAARKHNRMFTLLLRRLPASDRELWKQKWSLITTTLVSIVESIDGTSTPLPLRAMRKMTRLVVRMEEDVVDVWAAADSLAEDAPVGDVRRLLHQSGKAMDELVDLSRDIDALVFDDASEATPQAAPRGLFQRAAAKGRALFMLLSKRLVGSVASMTLQVAAVGGIVLHIRPVPDGEELMPRDMDWVWKMCMYLVLPGKWLVDTGLTLFPVFGKVLRGFLSAFTGSGGDDNGVLGAVAQMVKQMVLDSTPVRLTEALLAAFLAYVITAQLIIPVMVSIIEAGVAHVPAALKFFARVVQETFGSGAAHEQQQASFRRYDLRMMWHIHPETMRCIPTHVPRPLLGRTFTTLELCKVAAQQERVARELSALRA